MGVHMGPDRTGQILNFPAPAPASEDLSLPQASPPRAEMAAIDSLAEVDQIFEMRSKGLSESTERQSQANTETSRLQDEFSSVCANEIRPAMQAFLDRLRLNGGGGLLEEREGVRGAGVSPRVILWMSLSGELIGRPRRDQHPYLELDFDITRKTVFVAEGDMWKGHGTSGAAGTWIPSEITGEAVTRSLLGVLRRAAA
jgi:hypothetical protein